MATASSLATVTQHYMWDKTTQLQSKAELEFVMVDLLDHLHIHNHVFCKAEIALDIHDLVLRHTLKTAQKNLPHSRSGIKISHPWELGSLVMFKWK